MSKYLEVGIHEYLENSWGGAGWNKYVDRFRGLNDIVIYGAGIWGKHIFHLLRYYNIEIFCFAVTDKKNNPESIEGYAVKTIAELKNVYEQISVILTMSETSQSAVANNLKNWGIKNVLYFNRQEFWLSDIGVQNHRPEGEKECPVCGNKLGVYLPYGEHMRYNADCPKCSSKERHRAYWLYWRKSNIFSGKKINLLHFAPERAFYDKISDMREIDYYPVDIDIKKYGVREKVDITNIPYENDTFDIIICNHVLEHVSDDMKALSELYRVLKGNGMAFINAPIFDNYDVTLEKTEYNTPELRLKHYGQSDHVRGYGRDYCDRLSQVGFLVDEIHISDLYTKEELRKYGLQGNEMIHECRKFIK